MNVNEIHRLSEQYESLKRFHAVCNHNDVELATKIAGRLAVALDYVTTKSIIARIRSIVLNRICEIEIEIKKEATNG